MKAPDKVYVSIGYEAQTQPFHTGVEYIRKKIADPRWSDERRELRTCEQLYSEFIYRLSKLT